MKIDLHAHILPREWPHLAPRWIAISLGAPQLSEGGERDVMDGAGGA